MFETREMKFVMRVGSDINFTFWSWAVPQDTENINFINMVSGAELQQQLSNNSRLDWFRYGMQRGSRHQDTSIGNKAGNLVSVQSRRMQRINGHKSDI